MSRPEMNFVSVSSIATIEDIYATITIYDIIYQSYWRNGGVALSNKKLIVNPSVVLREEFDDWAILFNPDSANAVGINPVGVAVWKLMDGHRGTEDIIAEIRTLHRGAT